MNKRVLIVSWHFPPYKSSSAFNLFKRIKDTGYEYDVIQIKRADKPDNKAMFGFATSQFNNYEIEVSSEDGRNIKAREEFVEKVIELYQSLCKKNHYRVVLSHSHEFASHIAALKLKQLYPNLKWIASFGDPIAANPYNESYKFPLLKEDSEVESLVLQQADRIVVTNSYQQALVLSSQTVPIASSKFFVLPHCFDSRMYAEHLLDGSQHANQAKKFCFRHVGMLYKYKRTSEPFIVAAQRFIETYPELADSFIIEFYGAKDRYIDDAAKYGLENIVMFKGNVNYLTSLSVMAEADCLLLRDADFSDQGLSHTPFYPGKLADYLGAKKPIIAVTMKEGCVPDMLNELGSVSLTEHDIEGIVQAMYRAITGNLTLNFDGISYYSCNNVAKLARQAMSFEDDIQTILIAGHDLKFAKFIIDTLENDKRFKVIIDKWDGHEKHDEALSRTLLNQADVIFCEWGLGNLVWYSKHKKQGQMLITRVHAQELKTRHLEKCDHTNIDHYIFVSPYYFELMIAEFGLARHKCKMFFNMVDTELLNQPKSDDARFHLGMIGDVPQSKRLDKALDIFEKLYAIDKRYKLFIKGKRPEDYKWMHSKAKAEELAYYQQQYARINENGWADNVIFEGHGSIAEWLQNIGWILSVSDNESFHLAVAEGMASGAIPLILRWPGAEMIYPGRYLFSSVDAMVTYVNDVKSDDKVKDLAEIFDKECVLGNYINLICKSI